MLPEDVEFVFPVSVPQTVAENLSTGRPSEISNFVAMDLVYAHVAVPRKLAYVAELSVDGGPEIRTARGAARGGDVLEACKIFVLALQQCERC